MVDVQNLVGFCILLKIFVFCGTICAYDVSLHSELTIEFDASISQLKNQNVVQMNKNHNLISKKQEVGKANLINVKHLQHQITLKDGEVTEFNPGEPAFPFHIWDIDKKIVFPSKQFTNTSVLIHVFDPESGFLECMWNSDNALKSLATYALNKTNFIFIPKRASLNETYGALWMKNRILSVIKKHLGGIW